MPLISIVVPVYNTEKYLHQCLDSIVNQYNGKIEIILVDDGSTDGSEKICDEYEEQYSGFIKVIHKENGGLLLARRTGIQAASGEYIAHVDSDDYILNDAIEEICNAIENNPCDMLFFDYIYGAGQGKPERYIKLRDAENTTLINDRNIIIQQYLFGKNFNSMWMKVTKKSAVDVDADYHPMSMVANGEDVLQTLALIDRSASFLYIPKALYYYRRDNISMSKSYGTKDYDSFRTVNLKVLEYAKKWGMEYPEICDLKSIFLDKCMVILHQVRGNQSKDDYYKLMKKMSADDYFLDLADALKSSDTNKYNKIIFRLLKRKRYRLIDFLIKTVEKI